MTAADYTLAEFAESLPTTTLADALIHHRETLAKLKRTVDREKGLTGNHRLNGLVFWHKSMCQILEAEAYRRDNLVIAERGAE